MGAGLRWTLLLASAFIVTAAAAGRTEACSCMPPGTAAEEKEKAGAVFEGRVLSIAEGTVRQRAVHFEVLRAWKGAQTGKTVTVETNGDSAACGVNVVVGSVMLVYAHAHVQEAILDMSLCSRTAPIEHAKEDIAALGPTLPANAGEPVEPVPTGGAGAGGGGAGGEPPAPTPGTMGGVAGAGSGGMSGAQAPSTHRTGSDDGCAVGGNQPGTAGSWAAALALLWVLRPRIQPARRKSPPR